MGFPLNLHERRCQTIQDFTPFWGRSVEKVVINTHKKHNLNIYVKNVVLTRKPSPCGNAEVAHIPGGSNTSRLSGRAAYLWRFYRPCAPISLKAWSSELSGNWDSPLWWSWSLPQRNPAPGPALEHKQDHNHTSLRQGELFLNQDLFQTSLPEQTC